MAVVLVTEFMLVVWINGRFGFLACSLPRLERAGLSLCLVPYPCGLSSAFVLGQSSGRVLGIVLGHGTMRVSSPRVGVLFSFVYAHVELHAHAFAIGYYTCAHGDTRFRYDTLHGLCLVFVLAGSSKEISRGLEHCLYSKKNADGAARARGRRAPELERARVRLVITLINDA